MDRLCRISEEFPTNLDDRRTHGYISWAAKQARQQPRRASASCQAIRTGLQGSSREPTNQHQERKPVEAPSPPTTPGLEIADLPAIRGRWIDTSSYFTHDWWRLKYKRLPLLCSMMSPWLFHHCIPPPGRSPQKQHARLGVLVSRQCSWCRNCLPWSPRVWMSGVG